MKAEILSQILYNKWIKINSLNRQTMVVRHFVCQASTRNIKVKYIYCSRKINKKDFDSLFLFIPAEGMNIH